MSVPRRAFHCRFPQLMQAPSLLGRQSRLLTLSHLFSRDLDQFVGARLTDQDGHFVVRRFWP